MALRISYSHYGNISFIVLHDIKLLRYKRCITIALSSVCSFRVELKSVVTT